MAPATRVIGVSTKLTVKVYTFTSTGISTMVNGLMIKPMDTEPIFMQMEPSIKGTGRMTCSTATVSKIGSINQNMKASTSKVLNMGAESSTGRMAQFMMETGSKTKSTEREPTSGLMDVNTVENGKTTSCMATEFRSGAMAEGTKASTCKTKSMALEHTLGIMAADFTVSGRMEDNTEREPTRLSRTINLAKGSGSREREINGVKEKRIDWKLVSTNNNTI